MKKIFTIILFIILLTGIPVTIFLVKQNQDLRQRANPATTLYFEPQTKNVQTGEQFTLNVYMNTDYNQITAVQILINFDKNILTADSIQKGDFMQDLLIEGTVDNNAGQASIWLGAGTTPVTGTGIIAILKMTAKTNTTIPTQITFAESPETQARGVNEDETEDSRTDKIIAREIATITVGNQTDQSPLPTPSALASVMPSPTTNASPVSTASPQTTPASSSSTQPETKIISPVNNSTITQKQPQITGTSYFNALITININSDPQIVKTINANASGNWTYTPEVSLSYATYTISITGQDPITDAVKTVSSKFTIAEEGGSGGENIASPIPTPTAIPATTPASTPGSTSQASSITTSLPSSTVPTTGSIAPTSMIFILAVIMLLVGAAAILF